MKSFHRNLFLMGIILTLFLSGCVVQGNPYYAPGYPSVILPPVVVPGRGYGYWYGGNYWRYRNGYAFYNGHYYHNGWHGGGWR